MVGACSSLWPFIYLNIIMNENRIRLLPVGLPLGFHGSRSAPFSKYEGLLFHYKSRLRRLWALLLVAWSLDDDAGREELLLLFLIETGL